MTNKTEMKKSGRYTAGSYAYTSAVMLICILVNYLGHTLAVGYSLPCWLDSIGTFIAAYLYGGIAGAVIGCTGNIIEFLQNGFTPAYGIVSIFLALCIGAFARKKYFSTLFHTMTAAGAVTIGTVIIASVIDLFNEGGSTGNIWGDGVKDYLVENGVNRVLALFIGEFYLEFPDKLLSCLVLYLLVKLMALIDKRRAKKENGESTGSSARPAGTAVPAFIPVILAAALLGTPIKASAGASETEDSELFSHISFIQTVYNGSNGLLSGHANAIAATPDGILRIGTYAGLYRYNGSEFTLMDDIPEVRNVNCLYVDNEGRLWIGTNDNGVAIMINDRIANVINTSDGLPSDSIRSIVQSSTGEYYIGTSDGIVPIELKIGISVGKEIKEPGYIDRLASDDKGHTAAVNKEGKLFFLKDGRITTRFDMTDQGMKISCCTFDEDGMLLLGTVDGLLCRYDISGAVPNKKETIVCGKLSKINNICHDADGRIWVCADNGIGSIDSDGSFRRQKTGDFNHSIENMLTDYQGNLWFASSRLGLLRLSPSGIKDIYTDTGLKPVVVNATALFDGLLYAGSDDGLQIIDPDKHLSIENELTELLRDSRIRCLMPDSRGKLWICSYGSGLISYDKTEGAVSYSLGTSRIGTRVRTCAELSDGTIAVSSSTGVFFLKDGVISGRISYNDEFGYAQVLSFLETEDGTLYAGTDGNGIAVIKDGRPAGRLSKKDGLPSEVILRLSKDPQDGSIYIVTSNSICRMAEGVISRLDAFPYSNNYDVIADDDGELFVTGSAGVYVMDKEDLLAGNSRPKALLNSKNGLMGSLTANSFNAVSGKKLFLAADRGVFMADMDDYIIGNDSYRLWVSEVRVDDNPRSIERGSVLMAERDSAKIEFFPEIVNYTLEDPKISYFLEGFDSVRTELPQSELISVTYTNLPPGKYTFRLSVLGSDGKILEESAYTIEKQTAIYDDPRFKYYLVGVAAVFIGWLTWFITRTQLQRTLRIQQAQLEIALRQVQMGNETILAIAKTVDAKDQRTSKHSQRVSEYSALIAKEYGFSDSECDNLRKAALLHDIGKIAIPDSVLNKPARLTDEEYAVMKSHVTRGAEILKDFTLIDHVVEGARYHHERYDGKGYPDGLRGEEIPLYGRIIAIADAFDAMTANRVYRKKQDFDYVMGELHRGRGTQFDPQLLDIFLKLIDDKKIDIEALYAGGGNTEEGSDGKDS